MEAFTYSVSHDLRAPLRAIDGYCNFLEEDYSDKLDDEGRRLLGVVRKNARKMDKLIRDLLDLSRVTKLELQYVNIDMESLAADVCSEVAAIMGGNDFTIEIGKLPAIKGDSSLLRQAWVNLIGNAFKYSMKSPVRRVEIGSVKDKALVTYFVKDHGAGFEAEYAAKLFSPFQRLHKPEDFEGTGIGLALVQRIVVRHGGSVRAESSGPGKGASFYFSLPNKESFDA